MDTCMKVAAVLILTLLAGCTTVTTYDRGGNLIGSCRVSGLTKRGGSCFGYANGEVGVSRAGR